MAILIVDDSCDVRTIASHALDEYETLEAEHGEHALEILGARGDDVELIVLDLEMPVTNGWEALRIIRHADGWPDAKIVILSARDEPENVVKAWALGAEYYLTKPFVPETLLEIVRKALGSPVP